MTSPDPREREDGTLDEAMTSGLIEDAEQDRALVTEWDETLPALPVEPVPLDPQRLWRALVNVWPRTFGNRTSWTQPEFDMAVAAAREYDRLARRAASVTSPDPREREEPRRCGSCQTPGHYAGDGTHPCRPPTFPDRPVADREPLSPEEEAALRRDLSDGATYWIGPIRTARLLATLDAARAHPDEAVLLRSYRFREAVRSVFEAPGEWGPAQGYYAASIDHFIDMLRTALATTQPERRDGA